VYILIIRQGIEPTYVQYSGIRTFILTSMGFFNVLNLFSCLYLRILSDQFTTTPTPAQAWAFSVGAVTGSGYSGLTLTSQSGVAIVSAIEQLIGVFFFVAFISLALSRTTATEIGSNIQEYKARR
jgi:hypothetical protein